MRWLLEEYLNSLGLEVHASSSVSEALELVEKNQYDYVFSDLVMPKLRGDEFILQAVPFCKSECRFFLVSGGDPSKFQEESREASELISEFISKPFTQRTFYKILVEFGKRRQDLAS